MFDILVDLFFDKVKKANKKNVLTISGENREIKDLNLKEKNKEDVKTSLSKFFCNIESLYVDKNSIALSSRKVRLQYQDFYQK